MSSTHKSVLSAVPSNLNAALKRLVYAKIEMYQKAPFEAEAVSNSDLAELEKSLVKKIDDSRETEV